jgi:hypothetical protein
MSGRNTAARQEVEQYDRASQPTSRPWDCEAIADLFGVTLHLEGRKLHIPYNRIDDAVKALIECKRLDPAPRSSVDPPPKNPDIEKANADFRAEVWTAEHPDRGE